MVLYNNILHSTITRKEQTVSNFDGSNFWRANIPFGPFCSCPWYMNMRKYEELNQDTKINQKPKYFD